MAAPPQDALRRPLTRGESHMYEGYAEIRDANGYKLLTFDPSDLKAEAFAQWIMAAALAAPLAEKVRLVADPQAPAEPTPTTEEIKGAVEWMSEFGCYDPDEDSETAFELARVIASFAAPLREERDRLAGDLTVRLTSICQTIGGTVEGRPPDSGNYLQRLRELVAEEAEAKALRARIGKVLADAGCDCEPGPSGAYCDPETTCEEAGHEPCLAHLVERALAPEPKAET